MATDHDAIFKQLLTEFFIEFLDLFYPDVLELLDQTSITFLDKESFVDLLDPDRLEADLVVQVRLRDQNAFFLVHLEHQAQEDRQIDRRMFRYFARFHDRYDMPIYPIVLCSYATPRREAQAHYAISFPNFAVLTFQYRVVQLNRLNWRDYLRHPNPLATALMARMRIAPEERRQVKLACLTYLAGLSLPPRRKLGDLPPTIEDQLAALSLEQLDDLADALLDFTTRQDLDIWLSTHPPDLADLDGE